MSARSSHLRRSGSRRGVALVLVLAFIVLLTILIVSFLSALQTNRASTASYAKAIQTQEIAYGGIQDILFDLRSEIIAGSMVYSSNSAGLAYTNAYASAYIPITNATAQPARLGYAATLYTNAADATFLPSTLIRVSRADPNGGTALFPTLNTSTCYTNMSAVSGGAILNRASAANSSASSINGRYISAARWNKTYLLAATTQTTGGAGIQIPTAFSTNTPDWVFVTRAGSRVCGATELSSLLPNATVTTSYTLTAGKNPPANPVIGRYAFAIYDEGALLDANAAGYPASATNLVSGSPPSGTGTTNNFAGITHMVLGKSYLSDADLQQLPGLSGTTGTTLLSSLISLRNGSYSNVASSGSTYLQASYNYAQGGFLNFQSNGSASDSPLISRQDLIHFFKQNDSGFNSSSAGVSQALPYLGTFSRALSAPTWTPATNAPSGGSYNYAANAETASATNRDFANARYAKSGTVTHYFDDQTATTTSATYKVVPGDRMVQTRFSLAKIAWLSQADPVSGNGPAVTSAYGKAIRSAFGLQWKAIGNGNGGTATLTGNKCWQYVGSRLDGTTTAYIETLDQIAQETLPREPNFFELLKAAILNGSLGLSAGMTCCKNATVTPYDFRGAPYAANPGSDALYGYSFDRSTSPSVSSPMRISDMQILKIGADIIDQFDADSYPTAIQFTYSGMSSTYSSTTNGPVGIDHTLYGESDIVYGEENLPYLMGIYLIAGTLDATAKSDLHGWVQPQLWNPHLMASSLNTANTPMSFQIRAYGQAGLFWSKEFTVSDGSAKSGNTSEPALDGNYINFTTTTAGFQAFYSTPVPLTTSVAGVTCTVSGTNSTYMLAPSAMLDYSQNHFAAFWLGDDPTYTVEPDYTGSTGQKSKTYLESTAGYTFALGWVDSSGGFHPYSFIISPIGYTYGVIGNEKNGSAPAGESNAGSALPAHTGDDCHFYADLRTARFGTLFNWDSVHFTSTMYPNSGSTPSGDLYGAAAPFSTNFTYASANANKSSAGSEESVWMVNSPTALSQTGMTEATYYSDPDGIVRPGDSVFGNKTTGDGMQLFTTAGTVSTAAGDIKKGSGADDMPASTTNSSGNSRHGRRPVILNRPFRSVGELGYVFRDLPFKTLDFFSTASADAGLLDLFSVTDEATVTYSQVNPVVAGQVNLSNALQPVLAALLSGGSKKDYDTGYNLPSTDASALALAIAAQFNPAAATPTPLLNRSELVTRLGADPGTGVGVIRSALPTATDQSNKAYLEAPVRALSNVTNTRTWNLMIDIIAQSGHFSPTASTLNDFVVDGEKRYWLHIAIDRYTGKIVDQQLEPVYE